MFFWKVLDIIEMRKDWHHLLDEELVFNLGDSYACLVFWDDIGDIYIFLLILHYPFEYQILVAGK